MKETIIPGDHRDRRAWVKLLCAVDSDAKNGFGFKGRFLRIGAAVDLKVPSLVVVSDKTGHTLLELEESGEWNPLATSDRPAWAHDLRDVAREWLLQNPPTERYD
jgi:hypothetical protein